MGEIADWKREKHWILWWTEEIGEYIIPLGTGKPRCITADKNNF